MMKKRLIGLLLPVLAIAVIFLTPGSARASDYDEPLDSKNFWFQATPSVLWAGDPASTTTIEVHIVGRNDVKSVWMTGLGSAELYGRRELFDDGTHGDKASGDDIFTLADVSLSFQLPNDDGYGLWWGYVRVELNDGVMLGNEYGNLIGLVDPKYKDMFPAQDLGSGLSATNYAFFIEDSGHEVVDQYPVSNVYCGTTNFEAYRKLYSVFPDVFDFASLMPGMQLFRPSDLHENVPYNNGVSNQVEHIGRSIMDDSGKYGSAGKLKSVTYSSFGSIAIMDHELAHTWGMSVGKDLGLIKDEDLYAELGHWNKMTDIQGQMGAAYIDEDHTGHFAYNGDGTWRLISNLTNQAYSPLELYLMGLIPSSDIPDVHILHNPDLTDPEHITVESYETVTAQQIVASAGGERIPSYTESQKKFSMAFIVTQDLPYNDAAYAYFSLLSKELMSLDPPAEGSFLAPFYWATGGRATLNTFLGDYGVLTLPAQETAPVPTAPAVSEPPVAVAAALESAAPANDHIQTVAVAAAESAVSRDAGRPDARIWIIPVLLILISALLTMTIRRAKNRKRERE